MSLTWSIIAGFLYTEIVIVLLLVLPIFSPARWQKFFRSKFLSALSKQAQIYFYLLLGVLVIFLLEAIREMRKYSTMEEETSLNLGMQHSMRLFRAQRNFYIAGFSIFLSLVIRRLIALISQQASMLAQAEASMRQAQSASSTARTLLAEKSSTENKKTDAENKDDDESKTILMNKIADLEMKLKKEIKDKEAMKSQSQSLHREYDTLTAEFAKLQNKTSKAGGGKSD